MSQAADRNLTSHDLLHVGMSMFVFGSTDQKRLPPYIQNQVRDARVNELKAKQERLQNAEWTIPRSLSKEEAEELKTLEAEQAANPTRTLAVKP